MAKFIRVIKSKIVKKDNKYQVQSEKGKNLGTYDTKEKAEERLKQVEMFKHMKSKLFTYDEGFYYSLEMTQYYEPDTLTIEDIREHLTLQAISYTDSLLIYPEIVTVGDKMTLRSVGVDNDEVVCVSHDMIHKGNIVSVFSYQEGTEVDSLQLACVAEFIRDYIVLY